MKRQLLVLLLMVSTAHAALAQQDTALDGEWQMTIGGRDYAVNVPHTYNIMEGLEDYAGEAVYKRTLPITTDMKGRTVRLHFEAVHHDAAVYVNGRKVGEHLGKGYTPFSFDITSYLSPLTSNILEVHTSNAYTDKALPYKRSFDWSNDGGIYRSVRLHVSGKQTLRYVHVTPKASYHVLRQLMSPIDIVEVKPANAKKNEGSLAGQYDIDAADRDANIVLQVKNSIPSYTLRGYILRYADFSGRQQTIALPDMHSGKRYPLLLRNVNAQYAFEVVRPSGFSVIKY